MTDDLLRAELERFARQLASWEQVKSRGVDREDFVEAEVSAALATGEDPLWRQKVAFRPVDGQIGPFSVEGIAAAVLDAQAGDTIRVEAQLPADSEVEDESLKELAGEPVTLTLAIETVYRQRVPEIDDELARKLNMQSADEIRSIVAERLKRHLEAERRDAAHYALIEALLDRVDLDMPKSLVDRATLDRQRKLMIRALRSGMSRQQAEEMTRSSAERSREAAVRGLKGSFLLREIADKERIYVLDSEVQEQVRAFAASQGWTERRAQRYMEEENLMQSLRSDLRDEKTIQFLLDSAKVEEVDPELFAQQMQEARDRQENPGGQ